MSKETELEKILEDYLETIYQNTEGGCPICFAPDYPVNGDKSGYDEVSAEDAEQWQCDHHENCAVTVITKFLTAWNTREETTKQKTICCPECGSVEYVNVNLVGEGYRCCRDCQQDWWIDVEYSSPLPSPNIEKANEHIYDLIDRLTAAEKKLATWQAVTDANAEFVERIKELESKVRACENTATGDSQMAIEDAARIKELEASVDVQAMDISIKALKDAGTYIDKLEGALGWLKSRCPCDDYTDDKECRDKNCPKMRVIKEALKG